MATYYIDPTWTGTESGTEAEPFTTFAQVRALYANTDTVLFKGGTTLNESVINNKNDVTFSSYGTGRAILAGDGIAINCFLQTGRTGVTVTNINFVNGVSQCVKSQSGSHNFTITDCIISGGYDGLQCNAGDTLTIEDIEVFGCTRYGIRVEGGNNHTVSRVNVHDNGKTEGSGDNWDGFFLGNGSIGFVVQDSRAVNNGGLGFGSNFDFSAGLTGEDCIGTIRRCFADTGWMGISNSGALDNTATLTVESCISINHARGNYEAHGSCTTHLVNCYAGGTPPLDRVDGEACIKWAPPGSTGALTVTNCIILAANYDCAFASDGGTTTVTAKNNSFSDEGTKAFYRDDDVNKTLAQFDALYTVTGTVTEDPQLNPDYTLALTSPCLGTGDTSVLPLTDYSGRGFGNPTNMGVYSLPQLANNLLATNTGNTADAQNYDGVWTSQAWATIPDNTRYYPMIEGTGATLRAWDGNSVRIPSADATITNYDVAQWKTRKEI